MSGIESLANRDWRVIVNEFDLLEQDIGYPDPDRHGAYVAPLIKGAVGATVDDDEGDEVLDLTGFDGCCLAAAACIPQFAELLLWIKSKQSELDPVHFDSSHQYGRFMRELRDRVKWIEGCINDRPETMGEGVHGFERYDPEFGPRN